MWWCTCPHRMSHSHFVFITFLLFFNDLAVPNNRRTVWSIGHTQSSYTKCRQIHFTHDFSHRLCTHQHTHIVAQGVSVRISLHPHAIHDVTCLSVRLLSRRFCLSLNSFPLLLLLFHSLPVLCPAHHLPCRNRRGIKSLHSRTMRSIAPWRYTILSPKKTWAEWYCAGINFRDDTGGAVCHRTTSISVSCNNHSCEQYTAPRAFFTCQSLQVIPSHPCFTAPCLTHIFLPISANRF